MERLTKYATPMFGGGIPKKVPCFSKSIVKKDCPPLFCYKAKNCDGTKNRKCPYLQVMDKLAAYEDTMPLERAQELAQAEKDGRLVVLPYKIGDLVYRIATRKKYLNHLMDTPYIKVVEIKPENAHKYINEIGSTVFLALEEAEAALKKREETDNAKD